MRARALYACQAENAGEVSFDCSQVLIDVNRSDETGWLVGTVQGTGRRGLFPAVYTELAPESGDDMTLLRKLQSDGLLSSAAQLEAFRHDLDGGSTVSRSYTSTVQRSEAVYSTTSASSTDAPQVPVRSYAMNSSASSTTMSATRALPAAAPASPPQVAPQAQAATSRRALPAPTNANDLESARQREADAASAWEKAHLANKASSAGPSRVASGVKSPPRLAPKPKVCAAAKPQVPLKSSAAISEESERYERERLEAAAWEAKHLSKTKTLEESRDVARLFGAANASPKPATKHAVSIPVKPAVSVATKLAVAAASKPTASFASKPHVPPKSAAAISEESERYERERLEAASWEAKHLSKTKTLEESRDVARLFGAANASPRPATKHAVSISAKPAVSAATKPAVGSCGASAATCPRRESPIVRGSAPAAPPLPSSFAKSLAASSSMTRHETESRTMKSSSSSSSRSCSNGSAAQRNNPATENDAPQLPYSASRAAAMSELLAKAKPVPPTNPATANDAPNLPYDRNRAVNATQLEKRVDGSALPSSQQLIKRMNSQATSSSQFEDNFNPGPSAGMQVAMAQAHPFGGTPGMAAARAMMEPSGATAMHTTSSSSMSSQSQSVSVSKHNNAFQSFKSTSSHTSSESMSTSAAGSAPFPLTMVREVKGVLPFPVVNPMPLAAQNSYANKSSSSFSHQESHSMSSTSSIGMGGPLGTAGGIPRDALQRYARHFEELDMREGRRGVLSANTVRDVVAKSRLSDATLRHIWQLADRNMNGVFGPGEFNIIMHLVDCALRSDPIPNLLPIDLIHSAYV